MSTILQVKRQQSIPHFYTEWPRYRPRMVGQTLGLSWFRTQDPRVHIKLPSVVDQEAVYLNFDKKLSEIRRWWQPLEWVKLNASESVIGNLFVCFVISRRGMQHNSCFYDHLNKCIDAVVGKSTWSRFRMGLYPEFQFNSNGWSSADSWAKGYIYTKDFPAVYWLYWPDLEMPLFHY